MDGNATSSGPDAGEVTDWLLKGAAFGTFLVAFIAICMRKWPGAFAACYNKICCGRRRVAPEQVHEAGVALHEVAERVQSPLSLLVPPAPRPRSTRPLTPSVSAPELTRMVDESTYVLPVDAIPQPQPIYAVVRDESPDLEPAPAPELTRFQASRPFPRREPPPLPARSVAVLDALPAEQFLELIQHEPPLTGRALPDEKKEDDDRWRRGSLRL